MLTRRSVYVECEVWEGNNMKYVLKVKLIPLGWNYIVKDFAYRGIYIQS